MPSNNKIDALLQTLTNPDASNASIQTFLRALMDELGGVRALARMIADDLKKLDPGHAGRISLEKTIIAALGVHGQDIGAEENDPEQLRAMVLGLLEEESQEADLQLTETACE